MPPATFKLSLIGYYCKDSQTNKEKNMLCRITDEKITNPYDTNESFDAELVKTIEQCTLYDLMSDDISVWISKNATFGFVLEIENESQDLIREKCIHPCAMESFAAFCRSFLKQYGRIEGEL